MHDGGEDGEFSDAGCVELSRIFATPDTFSLQQKLLTESAIVMTNVRICIHAVPVHEGYGTLMLYTSQ